jgi:hypothetical protein
MARGPGAWTRIETFAVGRQQLSASLCGKKRVLKNDFTTDTSALDARATKRVLEFTAPCSLWSAVPCHRRHRLIKSQKNHGYEECISNSSCKISTSFVKRRSTSSSRPFNLSFFSPPATSGENREGRSSLPLLVSERAILCFT